MILGAKMLLKINQKINEILDAFLMDFGAEIVKNIQNNSVPVSRRWVPGILNLPIRHTHPDTPCSPRGGRRIEDASRRHTAAPIFWVSLAETLLFSRHLALLVNQNLVPGWLHVGSSLVLYFGFAWLDV